MVSFLNMKISAINLEPIEILSPYLQKKSILRTVSSAAGYLLKMNLFL